MISLYDGQITDLLPWKIAQSTEVRCISYAVQQEHQRMLRLAAHAELWQSLMNCRSGYWMYWRWN